MNICEPFIRRPIATTLLTAAIALAGGGITRGQIYGASSATASEPDRDAVTVEDFLATAYHQAGINSQDRLIAPGGRPIDIVRDGKVVEGLIG